MWFHVPIIIIMKTIYSTNQWFHSFLASSIFFFLFSFIFVHNFHVRREMAGRLNISHWIFWSKSKKRKKKTWNIPLNRWQKANIILTDVTHTYTIRMNWNGDGWEWTITKENDFVRIQREKKKKKHFVLSWMMWHVWSQCVCVSLTGQKRYTNIRFLFLLVCFVCVPNFDVVVVVLLEFA